jgi:hypothetical protein
LQRGSIDSSRDVGAIPCSDLVIRQRPHLTSRLTGSTVMVQQAFGPAGSFMKRLVEFPLEDGGTLLVEVDERPTGPVMRGRGGEGSTLAERTDRTFEEATASVTPAARSLINRLRAMDDPPDEIEVEFGIQLSAKTGAFIASVAAEANFRVVMTWRGSTTSRARRG